MAKLHGGTSARTAVLPSPFLGAGAFGGIQRAGETTPSSTRDEPWEEACGADSCALAPPPREPRRMRGAPPKIGSLHQVVNYWISEMAFRRGRGSLGKRKMRGFAHMWPILAPHCSELVENRTSTI